MPDELKLEPVIGAQTASVDHDRALGALAERQHGVVAHRQLLHLGLGRRAIGHRLERGRLHAIHRGVYAVGHRRLSRRGWWLAAVLAAGPGAVLSHRSAAELWGIRQSARPRIDVTRSGRRHAGLGIELFHCARLAEDEVTELEGIPVTTASRTLLDLAAVLPRQRLERALREAEVRRLGDAASLAVLLTRHPRRRGTAALRSILASGRAGDGVTRSALEERFLTFLDAHALPRPQINVHLSVHGPLLECDCVWRAQGLVVELDGHAAHSPRAAFEHDRARDRALNVAGWRVLRITWRQLHREGEAVAADLRALLGSADRVSLHGPITTARVIRHIPK